jgi:hypothetical protein
LKLFTNGLQIGEVLDDIMEDRLSISRLPTIEVKCIDGSYVSSDNRRLWILKQLERQFITETPSRILIKTQTVHLETDFIYITSFFKSPNSSRADTANFHIVGPS